MLNNIIIKYRIVNFHQNLFYTQKRQYGYIQICIHIFDCKKIKLWKKYYYLML